MDGLRKRRFSPFMMHLDMAEISLSDDKRREYKYERRKWHKWFSIDALKKQLEAGAHLEKDITG